MSARLRLRLPIAVAALLMTALSAAQFSSGDAPKAARKPSEGSLAGTLDALQLREIGPTNMAGRIADLAVYERDPRIFYVATAAGGVWKTTNGGTSYAPLFQQESSASLGAIAVSPTNPDVVWVGTGEASSRNSVGWGDGVYRSLDGGKTWENRGLAATMHIAKIRIHPNNPNVVWVAATGRLWGRSFDRGIFKTTDGGVTWRNVLGGSDKAGGIDLDGDPRDPNVLYAAMWDRIRKPYVFASGGLTSGLYKSTDGGESWKPIMRGLPPSPLGRIGLDVYRRDPNVLVALVEYANPNAPAPADDGADDGAEEGPDAGGEEEPRWEPNASTPSLNLLLTLQTPPAPKAPPQKSEDGAAAPPAKGPATPPAPVQPKPKPDPRLIVPPGSQMNGGGMFLSRDGGESWTFVRQLDPRPFYFSAPAFDPTDWRRVYLGGLNLLRTEDGGKNWKNVGLPTHADHHVVWVDPKDGMTVISGSDGGVNVSRDRAATWSVSQNMPIGQFYAVDYDTQRPYWVYGGLQDNGCWAIPTQSPRGGVGFWDAQSLFGGDGFYVRVEKNDPAIVYAESQGGNVGRMNRGTGERKGLSGPMTKAAGLRKDEKLRRNWNTPMEIGGYGDGVLYVGTNRLLRSSDHGDTFEAISPDLTANSSWKTATGLIAKRISINVESTGAEQYATITTISESPVTRGVIATGSDDGRINVTTDDGKTWRDVTPNIPGLPDSSFASRVVLSRWQPNRLYATFDNHRSNDFTPYLFRSDDLGATWTRMETGQATGDVNYVVREDPKQASVLYLGSELGLRISDDEGRSWSRLRAGFPTVPVYDATVNERDGDLVIGTHGRSIWTLDLEPLQSAAEAGGVQLYPPQEVVRMPFATATPTMGDGFFVARNTPGTLIYYRLAKGEKDGTTVTIRDAAGKEVATLEGPSSAGLNSVRWNGRGTGVAAPVGEYTVELKAGDAKRTAKVRVVAPTGAM